MFYNFEVIFLFFDISPLAFFSFPYFRGASLDFGAATHLGATCSPLLPGCHSQSHIDISPRKRLFPPAFRGASPCLICTSHLWHSSLFPISGVPLPASHQYLTPQTFPFPRLPGCSLPPYGSLASFPAELFLRSRECTGFPEKKVMWSAELSEEKR